MSGNEPSKPERRAARGARALSVLAYASAACGALLGLGLALQPVDARAQALTKAFGGFAASPDQPIDIQANRLDVDDNAKRAVFTGKVVARQDTFVMNSDTLEIRYAARTGAQKKQAAAGGLGGGSTEITLLTARGSVFIQSAKENSQTARGDWAEFDVKTRIITMGDVVTLKQGKNVIRGTRLVINLETGRSSVQSASPSASAASGQSNGRIRMVITPDKALRSGLGNNGLGALGSKRPKQQRTPRTSASRTSSSTRRE